MSDRKRQRRIRQEPGEVHTPSLDENNKEPVKEPPPSTQSEPDKQSHDIASGEPEEEYEGDATELSQEDLEIPPNKFEYLDHPADVQIHSWGENIKEAYEQAAVAMFGYMTEIDTIEILDQQEIEVSGHDMESLLFNYLDECLFMFSAEPFFIARKVVITEFDKEEFSIKAKLFGEEFDLAKHPQGTEVKAITYASMNIYDDDSKDQHELFVIIDI